MEDPARDGITGDPSQSLVAAFCCHLEATLAEGAKPATLSLYEGRHKQFLTFLQQQGHSPPFSLDLLNAANVRRASIWVRERSHGQRGGESAARALVTTLKTTSAWLADEGYTEVDLIARVKRPRITSAPRTPFAQAEVRQLALATVGQRTAERDLAIIHLLLDTGMRVGGLCSITIDDFNLKERRVTLRLKGGSRQTLYFGTAARRDGGSSARAMRAYWIWREAIVTRHPAGRDQDHVFLAHDAYPLHPEGVRNMLERLGRDSGVPHVFPHRFRHTFATRYLVEHPGDESGLRGILGHLSADMYRVYLHLSSEILAQRAERVSLSEAWLGEEAAV